MGGARDARGWQLDAFCEHCDLRHAKENDRARKLPYGGSPPRTRNEAYIRECDREEVIEIRKWLRPRDSPDSSDFAPSSRSKRRETRLKSTCTRRRGRKERKKKMGKKEHEANAKQRVDRTPCDSLLETQALVRSEVLLCARHRAGIIIYMAAPDNLHKSAVQCYERSSVPLKECLRTTCYVSPRGVRPVPTEFSIKV